MMDSLKHWLHQVDHKLLPQDAKLGVLPYLNLLYLGIFFIGFLRHETPFTHYWAACAGTLTFLVIYFRSYWANGNAVYGYIGAVSLIGVLMCFINPGAGVFFIYACAFAPQLNDMKKGFTAVAVVIGIVFLTGQLLAFPTTYTLTMAVISLLIGTVSIFQHEVAQKNALLKLSQEEIQRLGATAERERIARDLHDVIGHSLSTITMKAQLAKRLFGRDDNKAKQELLELEKISRQTLSDVRKAVSGYRSHDFDKELANAKAILNSADIEIKSYVCEYAFPVHIRNTLGLVLREAITNLIRHSSASKCELNITCIEDKVKFLFSDNGEYDDDVNFIEGNGLLGMRERIAQHRGLIAFSTTSGFSIKVELPL